MNKKALILVLLIFVAVVFVIYLNRSYAHFYSYLGNKQMVNPNISESYLLGESTSTFTYVAIGDSLTAGVGCGDYRLSFPYFLGEKISQNKKVKVINLGIPGGKSFDVLRLTEEFKDKADLVTLFIGTNDIHDFVPAKKFKANLISAVINLKSKSAKVILVKLPYLGSRELVLWPYSWYFNFKTDEFNKIIDDICLTEQVQCLNISQAEINSLIKNKSFYSQDLFHPSCDAYKLWAQYIYDNIR